MRLPDLAELEHSVELVQREAERLLMHASAQLAKVREAADTPHARLVEAGAERELATIGRQLTRAQAVLVHHDDERAAAARAVIGYCDEADARAPRARPVALGVTA